MEHPALQQILTECARPPAQEATVDYLAENLGKFVKVGIPAMICIPPAQGNLAELMRRAVLQCGGVPVMIGDDLRWKSLLRLGFSTKAETVIGPPLIVLGLTKLSKATGIPLFIQNVLTFGYPCLDWMIDGIIHGLDCSTWGCYTPEADVAVAGFSCDRCRGIHLRTEEFGMDIVDEGGRPLPAGAHGRVVLYRHAAPQARYATVDWGRMDNAPCPCGNPAPRLLGVTWGGAVDPTLMALNRELHSWTSVLDCQVTKGRFGLEIEIVAFPGEKLPKLPSCARLSIRRWDPEADAPMRWF